MFEKRCCGTCRWWERDEDDHICVNEESENLSIFDFLKMQEPAPKPQRILSVGDKIGRVVLGECRIATITEVEGNDRYGFYRTDRCCYSIEEGYRDIPDLIAEAEENRKKYKTIIPQNLSERITVEYEPRDCDGKILWAQIGIIGNMLFWKKDVTYQFLEPYKNEKKLRKEYEKHRKKHNGADLSEIPDSGRRKTDVPVVLVKTWILC